MTAHEAHLSEALRTIEWCYRSENGEGVPAMLQRFPLNEAAQDALGVVRSVLASGDRTRN